MDWGAVLIGIVVGAVVMSVSQRICRAYARRRDQELAKSHSTRLPSDDVRKADELVREFGRVVDRELGRAALMPESTLPAPKDQIKVAFRLIGCFYATTGELDQPVSPPRKTNDGRPWTQRDLLTCAYGLLADFVSEDVALQARRYKEVLRKYRPDDTPPARSMEEIARRAEQLRQTVDEMTLAGELLAAPIPIVAMRRSTEECAALMEEFGKFLETAASVVAVLQKK
jgi:hypothetical protein